jgi:hypothetical protein
MRALRAAVLLLGPCLAPLCAQDDASEEVTICNSGAEPVAYIADDMTIFLWSGKPVAYLSSESGTDQINIFGFNGKHLGWFSKGVIYDHDGLVVGAIPKVLLTPEKLEGLKGLKELLPLKSLKELAPMQPLFQKKWSDTPLQIFLNCGVSED